MRWVVKYLKKMEDNYKRNIDEKCRVKLRYVA